jgi:hypothetical protein
MIHATCHTADNVVCLEFDATPWFSEAGAPSIIDLAQHGWTGAAIAESLERRRGYERLHDLIEYAAKRLQPESLEDLTWNTFECIVDGPEARPGSRKTGLMLWQESAARVDISRKGWASPAGIGYPRGTTCMERWSGARSLHVGCGRDCCRGGPDASRPT